VRGGGVFLEYWGRPDATGAAFTADGWFRTGDVAALDDGYYRILGRSSVDIIKTGGYKVSALEIEEALRAHDAVADCAVIGLPDDEWGERVCAAVVAAGADFDTEAVRAWLAQQVAPYKLPRAWAVVAELPRNAMGKVVKTEVRHYFNRGTS
jgi:malonyl-CoA/methylmalonyl-CoA synthetase